MIFTSEPLELIQKNNFQAILSNSLAQSYFAKKIYQEKFNQVKIFYIIN